MKPSKKIKPPKVKPKGYAKGGDVLNQQETDNKLITTSAGAIGDLTLLGAGAMSAKNTPDEQGMIDVRQSTKTGAVTGAGMGLKTGAKLGATVGSVIPGVGTGVGAAIGAAGGAAIGSGIGAVTANKKAKKQNTLTQENLDEIAAQELAAKRGLSVNTALTQRNLENYKDGGKIEGKGTAKSDSIKAKVKEDSFVVPAENSKAAEVIREKVLKAPKSKKANLKQSDGEEVRLSDGEHLFTPSEVAELSAKGIDLNKLAPEAKHELEEHMKCGGTVKGYKAGGTTKSNVPPTKKEIEAAQKKKVKERDDYLETKNKLLIALKDPNDPNFEDNKLKLDLVNQRIETLNSIVGEPTVVNENVNVVETPSSEKVTVTESAKKLSAPKITPKALEPTTAAKTSATKVEPVEQLTTIQPKPQATEPIVAVNPNTGLAASTAPITTPPTTTTTTTDPPSASTDWGKVASTGLSALTQYGIPIAQTAIGLNALNKAGKRPVDVIDQDYLATIGTQRGIVDRANKQALFGLSAEENAMLEQKNQAETNAQRFAARNYSGGSAAAALNNERAATNEAYGRGLAAKTLNRNLMMDKQAYADSKQSQLNALMADKADRSRRLFNDTLTGWNQNQMAGAGLVNSGITNLTSADRYRQELEAARLRNEKYGR
jgi:hypothetical protein